MLNTPFIANLLWALSGYMALLRFKQACRDPLKRQMQILKGILASNLNSDYGRACGFESIHGYEDFQQKVPIVQYDDIREDILKMAKGTPNVLTSNGVTLLEPSGGSSVGIKFIPYTRSLAREFDNGIRPWIANLLLGTPGLLSGEAYWSISPANEVPQIPGAQIPVGFKDDTEYLSRFARRLMGKIMAVPNWLSRVENHEDHRFLTLLFLLKTRNLRLISVWNPTFLTLLLDQLKPRWTELLRAIETGEIQGLSQQTLEVMDGEFPFPADPSRKAELEALGPESIEKIWPKLKLISCWMDGSSRPFAQQLKHKYFPGTQFQPKGLLATEAFVSLPILGIQNAVLAINSHFYEFIPVEEDQDKAEKKTLRAHELKGDELYYVLVTTSGGLYRYQLNDIVRVSGHYKNAPCLEFISKSNQYSDLFGEKLSADFVSETLDQTFAALNLAPLFYLLAPRHTDSGTAYCLFLEMESMTEDVLHTMIRNIDEKLRQNFHYDHCRNLGQLGPLDISFIASGSANRYLEKKAGNGQKLGDIKPSVLDGDSGWADVFEVIQ